MFLALILFEPFFCMVFYSVFYSVRKYTWVSGFIEMKNCVNSQKAELFFPHLVIALCCKVAVPIGENEQFMKPTKSIIGESLYKQYVEL